MDLTIITAMLYEDYPPRMRYTEPSASVQHTPQLQNQSAGNPDSYSACHVILKQ